MATLMSPTCDLELLKIQVSSYFMDRFHPNVGIKEAELPDIPAAPHQPATLTFQDSLLEVQHTTAELLDSSSLAFFAT